MKRFAVLLGCALVGCERDAPPAEEPIPPPIDYADWPAATAKPFRVSFAYSGLCAPWPEAEAERAVDEKEHGPHTEMAIEVRVNPVGLEAFKANQPVPVGTVVVKVKNDQHAAYPPPEAVGAMIKRAPGYDPAGGDWEYYYDPLDSEKGPAVRGKIETCVECHRRAAATDFLFRPYLDPAKAAAGDLRTIPVLPARDRPAK